MDLTKFSLVFATLCLACCFPVSAQFQGGAGDGFDRLVLPIGTPCTFYQGDSLDGFALAFLAAPDTCDYFLGSTGSGTSRGFLASPIPCPTFRGSVRDGAAFQFAPSPIPCPTFRGFENDGFAMGDALCLPLEVEVTELYGRLEGNNGYLWWHTFSELNNLGFILQKSLDLFSWEEIAFLEGVTQSNTLRNYEHTDEEMAEGVNYYRWEQIDLNGTRRISNVVSLLYSSPKDDFDLVLYPVPLMASKLLNVYYRSAEEGNVQLRIIDLEGKVVYDRTISKDDRSLEFQLPSDFLSAGIYILLMEQNDNRLIRRFVVQ